MKTHNLSKLGYLVSGSIMLSSIVRWMFIYIDISQGLLGFAIGFLIGVFSYLYNWMRNKDEEDKKQDERLNAIVSWWMKMEKEENINVAKGEE